MAACLHGFIAATVASVNWATPALAAVTPFPGLKSASAFPISRKVDDITSLASNGGLVQCMLLSAGPQFESI